MTVSKTRRSLPLAPAAVGLLAAIAAAGCSGPPPAEHVGETAAPISKLTSGLQPAATSVDWSTPATLSVSGCIQGELNGPCGPKPVAMQRSITWGAGIETMDVVSTSAVRFGPFTAHRQILALNGMPAPAAHFNLTVFGRSPAIYDNGSFAAADLKPLVLGSASATLTTNTSEDLYVTVRLPSVFTAVQIQAEVDYGDPVATGTTSSFPSSCGVLEPTISPGTSTSALDAGCMKAVVNPLAVLAPHWMPISIIYEPPGNCSWSNLTQENVSGAQIGTAEQTSTSTQAVWDEEALGNTISSGNFTETAGTAVEQTQSVAVSFSQSLGTRYGTPTESPGNPLCNTGAVVPERTDAGPGKGDMFVLMENPTLLYWNSANATNSLLVPQMIGGGALPPVSVVLATAYQIATGTGLQAGVSFTEAERDAILALDPFFAGGPSPSSLPPRFLVLDENVSLSAGASIEQSLTQAYQTSSGQTLIAGAKSATSSSPSLSPYSLSMQALAYGGGAAAGAAAGAVGAALLGSAGAGFADAAKGLATTGIDDLVKDQTSTTVTMSYGRNTLIDQADDSAVTERFFVMDTNQGMTVALYYDAFFGTFAVVRR